MTLSAAEDPDDLPLKKKEYVLYAKSSASTTHLLPAVLIPGPITGTPPAISFDRSADRLVITVGADTLIWKRESSGEWVLISD